MARYRDQVPLECKVYVGDLGSGASKQELEEAFRYYGPLRNVWVARNPPGFAFVEFEDSRDAEDAVRALDGRTLCGRRVRVELSNGRTKRRFRGGGGGPPGRSGRSRPQERCYDCGEWGHFARDCQRYSRRGGGGRKSRSRSRSRSPSRNRNSKSRSRSRSASHGRSRSRSRSVSRSPSRSRSVSRTPKRGGNASPNSRQNGE